jgi:membrane protease YdiL (CAAX protease family)
LEAFPVFLIAMVLSVIGAILASGVSPACDMAEPTSACGPVFALITLFTELGFVIAVVFWIRVVNHAPLTELGPPGRPALDIATGFLGGLGLQAASWVIGIVIQVVGRLILGHPPEAPEQIPEQIREASLIWPAVVAVLAAPIGEELFFRGFLFRGLRRRFSVWPAALISAVCFSLVHIAPGSLGGSVTLVVALFPVGVGLAWIYEKRRSLVACIVAHATFNLIGVAFLFASR